MKIVISDVDGTVIPSNMNIKTYSLLKIWKKLSLY